MSLHTQMPSRVGWLQDDPGYIGGAELTAAAFREAVPDGVEIVDCPRGGVVEGLARYVIHNCVSYAWEDLSQVRGPMTYKYWHDTGPHIHLAQWQALHDTTPICCSPLQAKRMGMAPVAELIPPAVPLEPFRKAAENVGERKGAVAVGPWMNPAKNPEGAAEWAKDNGGIDFLGGGPYAPDSSVPVNYEDLPEVLALYKTFVHLPREIEPFGRTAVEAWAAGCDLVLNRLVGSRYWIEEAPEKLDSAAEDFWSTILGD